mmetsp:Transcript_52808/g.123522  ORF Transcript_52808/g.123522 Transcript_52808/m.123522 type:complete len:226 (+) Transcript_52808:317-994(+)
MEVVIKVDILWASRTLPHERSDPTILPADDSLDPACPQLSLEKEVRQRTMPLVHQPVNMVHIPEAILLAKLPGARIQTQLFDEGRWSDKQELHIVRLGTQCAFVPPICPQNALTHPSLDMLDGNGVDEASKPIRKLTRLHKIHRFSFIIGREHHIVLCEIAATHGNKAQAPHETLCGLIFNEVTKEWVAPDVLARDVVRQLISEAVRKLMEQRHLHFRNNVLCLL